MERVVITGSGVVSALGQGREDFARAVLAGADAVRPIGLFPVEGLGCGVAGEIADFDPREVLGKKGLRLLDRTTRLVLVAAHLALEDAGVDPAAAEPGALGLALGTTMGSSQSRNEFSREGLEHGPRGVNPGKFPNTVINSPAAQVALRFGLTGVNSTISSGTSSDLEALGYAADMVRNGRAEAMLAGGVQELCEVETWYLERAGLLCRPREGAAPRSRPWDRGRTGLVPGEGAVLFVLESESRARARGARVLGVLGGVGVAADLRHLHGYTRTAGHLEEAIAEALGRAGCAPGDLGWVAAGADSSRRGDRAEAAALARALGTPPRAFALKSLLGDAGSAAGSLQVAAALAGLAEGRVPPTAHLDDLDPACPVEPVRGEAAPSDARHVLVTAAGPTGQSAAVVVSRGDA